jgi:hypothetical protein
MLADADLRIAATAICAHLDSRHCKHHGVTVRTTVTLDPDLAIRLEEYAHRKRTSFKTALNTLLRRGLAGKGPPPAARRRFAVEPHSGRFQPGVDPGRLNQLVDQLETEDFRRTSQGDQ